MNNAHLLTVRKLLFILSSIHLCNSRVGIQENRLRTPIFSIFLQKVARK